MQELGVAELRLIMALIGAVILVLIYVFGHPKKSEQGKRIVGKRDTSQRIDPVMGEGVSTQNDMDLNNVIDRLAVELSEEHEFHERRTSDVGKRPNVPVERIVTLFVAARGGETITGSDLVVAAEKAGLQFGDMKIFHRLITGKPEAGPVFSMANMVKPGSFNMRQVDTWSTPGVTFFMTLPGPLSALDTWDAMLPCAQRLAELVNAHVLDEERNALGRQRIAHIRDELRAYDRKQGE